MQTLNIVVAADIMREEGKTMDHGPVSGVKVKLLFLCI